MTGTKDDCPIGDTKAAERRIPFDHTRASPAAYLLTFNGGDHLIFSGRPRPAGPESNDAEFQKQVRLASTAFWDAYLKEEAAAKKWLKEDFQKSLGDEGTLEKK